MRLGLLTILVLLAAATPARAVTVTGRVTDQVTGKPIRDINVDAGNAWKWTNNKGRYSIVPSSDANEVCFSADFEVNYQQRCRRFSGPSPKIDVALAPSTGATGTVWRWNGRPLEEVCVVADTPVIGGVQERTAATDADGNYRLEGLMPGAAYTIGFLPGLDQDQGCNLGPGRPGLAEQWFDLRAASDEAVPVTPKSSEMIGGIDAYLGTSPTAPADGLPAKRVCTVPRLINMTFADARERLSAAACSTLRPILRPSRKYARGRVMKSSIAAKRHVRRGRAIQLTVSRGGR